MGNQNQEIADAGMGKLSHLKPNNMKLHHASKQKYSLKTVRLLTFIVA